VTFPSPAQRPYLIRVGLRLIQRSRDFLAGAWAEAAEGPRGRDSGGVTQPIRPAEEESVRALILGHPGVTAIREPLLTFIARGQLWLVIRLDIDDGLRGAHVGPLVHVIQSDLKREAEGIYRVDLVPIWRSTASQRRSLLECLAREPGFDRLVRDPGGRAWVASLDALLQARDQASSGDKSKIFSRNFSRGPGKTRSGLTRFRGRQP
jgi:hypothetical protein